MKISICFLVVVSFTTLLVEAGKGKGKGKDKAKGKGNAAALTQDVELLKEKVSKLEKEQSIQKGILAKLSLHFGEKWELAMNLNPADGHIMGYTTGWATGADIGSDEEALKNDYLNGQIWREPVSYIAIVRHQSGVVDAVKVFKFVNGGRSLLIRFKDMNPGREIVTIGGAIQESIADDADNMADDPIFSVGGDLAFNWGYSDNGARIVLTGGHLSSIGVNDDNTHGLGNDFHCNPIAGTPHSRSWPHEISNIQDCPLATCRSVQVQGTDHGPGGHLKSGTVYGNYAIYVSDQATSFPKPGAKLELEMSMSD